MPAVGAVRRAGRGVAILADEGEPIRAVADGEVAKILEIAGFGNVLILRHGDGWSTVYGHAESYSVRPGEQVRSGAVVGVVGSTGSLEGPRLHFEVRQGTGPEDPLDWLRVPPGISVQR